MTKRILGFALFAAVLGFHAQADWVVREKKSNQGSIILSVSEISTRLAAGEQSLSWRSLPFALVEGDGFLANPPTDHYEETVYSDANLPAKAKIFLTRENPLHKNFADTELRAIVEQGPAANRIVLTILGDGYTMGEKEKFFGDAQRMTKDLFGEKTFATYLPLFNVYAVFVPSKDSGFFGCHAKGYGVQSLSRSKGIEAGHHAWR